MLCGFVYFNSSSVIIILLPPQLQPRSIKSIKPDGPDVAIESAKGR